MENTLWHRLLDDDDNDDDSAAFFYVTKLIGKRASKKGVPR